jgi:glycosyltransferase involved in cell wall biosynthesis
LKIAILNNCVPFLSGGAEYLAGGLTTKLREYGHEAMLVRIPFCWEPAPKILECMLACRLLRLPNVDRAIGLKFPAYFIPHEHKTLWLLHQFRQAYDFWGTEFQGLPDTAEGRAVRDAVIHADDTYLPQVRKIYTNSHITSGRLERYNHIGSEVLYPPLLHSEQFHCEEYGDFLFYPSRINASKRQRLAVESMRYVRSGVKLIVAGKVETGQDLRAIDTLIRRNNLQDRVTVVNRFITEQEKADWFAHALGCVYIPYDEDSYGYVTLEAFSARKPMITCLDSGGVDVVVKDGETGRVVPPEPRALAAAMDALHSDKAAAQRMGEAGWERMRTLDIGWDRVIRCLTQ